MAAPITVINVFVIRQRPGDRAEILLYRQKDGANFWSTPGLPLKGPPHIAIGNAAGNTPLEERIARFFTTKILIDHLGGSVHPDGVGATPQITLPSPGPGTVPAANFNNVSGIPPGFLRVISDGDQMTEVIKYNAPSPAFAVIYLMDPALDSAFINQDANWAKRGHSPFLRDNKIDGAYNLNSTRGGFVWWPVDALIASPGSNIDNSGKNLANFLKKFFETQSNELQRRIAALQRRKVPVPIVNPQPVVPVVVPVVPVVVPVVPLGPVDRVKEERLKTSTKQPTFTKVQETPIPREGCSAFHRAAFAGDLEDLQDYLQGGFDLGTVDRHGDTALAYAVAGGQPEVVDLLLRSQIPWHLVNKAGRNFADLAFGRYNPAQLTLTVESQHPYTTDEDMAGTIAIPGAVGYLVTFDDRSDTAFGSDYAAFFNDQSCTTVFGSGKYTGPKRNFPGVDISIPVLVIPAASFHFQFTVESSNEDNHWGFKMQVLPLQVAPVIGNGGSRHTGEWREFARTQFVCALDAESLRNSTCLCCHPSRPNPIDDHWSCCGQNSRDAPGCSGPPVAPISLGDALNSPPQGPQADRVRATVASALQAVVDREIAKAEVPVEHSWTAFKYFKGQYYQSFDKLLGLVGLTSVKKQILLIVKNVYFDMTERPEESQVAKTASYNFVLTGNPGTGKTSVSDLLAQLLIDIGLRPLESKYYKTTGAKLLEMGSKDVAGLVEKHIPGIVFIDEAHQLEPKSNKTGKAIVNHFMDPMESRRTEFTVIVAGYKKRIEEDFIAADEGLKDRFKYYIHFDDYTQDELRTIFLSMIRSMPGWGLDNSDCADGRHKDLATVIAAKVGRHAGQDGFSNARAIRSALEIAVERCTSRLSSTPGASAKDWVTLKRIDIVGNRIDLETSPPVKELRSLIGLATVKSQIEDFIRLFNANYVNEWRGDKTRIFKLHRVFVGNPGSGKTQVARLYGRVLKEMGFLSKGDVEYVGASSLIGDAVGVTQRKVAEMFNVHAGKVIIIDEAAQLAKNHYGQEGLKVFLERIQDSGQDLCVILTGYEEDMIDFFETSDVGLRRRFGCDSGYAENFVYFPDYNDEELAQIAVSMGRGKFNIDLSEEVARFAIEHHLSKLKNKPGFGNGGAVENLLTKAQNLFVRLGGQTNPQGFDVLAKEHFPVSKPNKSATEMLANLVNADHISKFFSDLKKSVVQAKRRAINERKEFDSKVFLEGYTLVGSPGTGKTTVARIFGELFKELGLLGSGVVVETSGPDLVGTHVGDAKTRFLALLDKALGGVLFIDEAYVLMEVGAREVIESMLQKLTEVRYMGKVVVILAGYEFQVSRLFTVNPGLRGRFKKQVKFLDFKPEDCWEKAVKYLSERYGEVLSDGLQAEAIARFKDLMKHESFQNARDVELVVDNAVRSRDVRGYVDDDEYGNGEPEQLEPISREDLIEAFTSITEQRPRLATSRPAAVSLAAAAGLAAESSDKPLPPPVPIRGRGRSQEEASTPGGGRYLGGLPPVPSSPGGALSLAALSVAAAPLKMVESQAEHQRPPPAAAPQAQTLAVVEEEEEEEDEEEEELEEFVELDIVWEEVESAFKARKLDHNDILAAMEAELEDVLPAEIFADVQKRSNLSKADLKQKLAKERAQVANNIRKAIEEAKSKKKSKVKQRELLRRVDKLLGVCPYNFVWVKVKGGYRCSAGPCFISDDQVASTLSEHPEIAF